jgi:hypothetical protein
MPQQRRHCEGPSRYREPSRRQYRASLRSRSPLATGGKTSGRHLVQAVVPRRDEPARGRLAQSRAGVEEGAAAISNLRCGSLLSLTARSPRRVETDGRAIGERCDELKLTAHRLDETAQGRDVHVAARLELRNGVLSNFQTIRAATPAKSHSDPTPANPTSAKRSISPGLGPTTLPSDPPWGTINGRDVRIWGESVHTSVTCSVALRKAHKKR